MAKLSYEEACHAMQSGVAMEMNLDAGEGDTSPKQLRTGVNSALCNQAALARLLMAKGIITMAEYETALTDELNLEVQRYEERLSARLKAKISLR